MRLPSNNPITMPFGATDSPYSPSSPHKGVDIGWRNAAGATDRNIYAPVSGKVITVPNNGNDGNGAYMYYGNMFIGMLHNYEFRVANNQTVNEGDLIAVMGETGKAEGVHCHFCVKVGGVFVDPLTLITPGKGAALPTTTQADPQLMKGYVLKEKGAKDLWRGLIHREPENDQVWRAWVGKEFEAASVAFMSSTEWLTQNHILKVAYPQALASITEATSKLTAALADDEIDKATIAKLTTELQVAQAQIEKKVIDARLVAPAATKAPWFVRLFGGGKA